MTTRVLVVALLAALLIVPVVQADRKACNTALVAEGVCRSVDDVLWYIALSRNADQRFQTGLALDRGCDGSRTPWTLEVICTQAMVDVGQCTAAQLLQLVPNPETERQAAKRRFREWVRYDTILRADWELIDRQKALEAAAAKAALAQPDTGD